MQRKRKGKRGKSYQFEKADTKDSQGNGVCKPKTTTTTNKQ